MLAAWPGRRGGAITAAAPPSSAQLTTRKIIPIVLQISALPGQKGWESLADRAEARSVLRVAIDEYIAYGFTGLEYPFGLPSELEQYCLDYARSHAMFLTYNYTFAAGHGVEIFGRDAPSAVSVYSSDYPEAVRRNLAPVLQKLKQLPGVYNLFCYQDEPFHARSQSFDTSEAARSQFRERYGYDMPLDIDVARSAPREWLDLLNFQSDTFSHGWRQVYRLIKQSDPEIKVILTHDSHSAFGAGVASNEKIAVDDVFHWGADFADTFVFDIYPYMMHDFRYGECGKIRQPRMSQMHFAFSQMRNLTYSYGKELGFWFGTYNREWFKAFMGPAIQSQGWAEAETTFTAVAQGANLLISGYKVPEDKQHWDTLGNGLRVLQDAPGLLSCPKKKAKACFVFPRTQYIQLQQEYWNVATAYEFFLQAFGELDCLHEEQIRDHGLGDYRILVLFDVVLLPETVAKRIVEFVNEGGTIIADCVPRLDEYRNPLTIMLDLFGVQETHEDRVQRSGVWIPSQAQPHWFIAPTAGHDEDVIAGEIVDGTAFNSRFNFRAISPRVFQPAGADVVLKTARGDAVLASRQSGNGKAYLLGFCMQDTAFIACKDGDDASRASLQQLLWMITQQARAIPSVHSTNPDIEVSLRANGSDAYVFAINHEADDVSTQLSLAKPEFVVGAIQNLTEGRHQPFQIAEGRIILDVQVPRDRPQLLRFVQ